MWFFYIKWLAAEDHCIALSATGCRIKIGCREMSSAHWPLVVVLFATGNISLMDSH